MHIGYGRTSTADHLAGLEAQVRVLQGVGTEKIFQEHATRAGARPEFERCLGLVRDGDVLLVTRMDRLVRSVQHLLEVLDKLDRKSVGLIILSMGGEPLDTRAASGRLQSVLLAAVAEFERTLMLARQREGVATAQTEAKCAGRKPAARRRSAEVYPPIDQGNSRAKTAQELRISETSVYHILCERRKCEAA